MDAKPHLLSNLCFDLVSGVSRAKIEEVTLNALRTRQSLVKGERLVRHEVRAVLHIEIPTPKQTRHQSWLAGFSRHRCSQNCSRCCVSSRRQLTSLIEMLLPKRVCHTQQQCDARGDKWSRPRQAWSTVPPSKNRCEKRATSRWRISFHTDKNRYYT